MTRTTISAALLLLATATIAGCDSVEPGGGALDLVDTAQGCASFQVYAPTRSGRDVVVLEATHDSLRLDTLARSFDLASTSTHRLALRLDRFATMGGVDTYCNDVAPQLRPLESWRAVSGRVTLSARGAPTVPPGDVYLVDVTLEDIRFVSPDGDEERTISHKEYRDVLVGWYPG